MINISELRIGNILTKDGEIITVDSIYLGKNEYLINIESEGNAYNGSEINGIELSECEQISLTEDILLDSGFCKVRSEREDGEKCTLWNTEHFELIEMDKNKNIFEYYSTNGLIVKHVHQLQNLWFALMKTELEISIY